MTKLEREGPTGGLSPPPRLKETLGVTDQRIVVSGACVMFFTFA